MGSPASIFRQSTLSGLSLGVKCLEGACQAQSISIHDLPGQCRGVLIQHKTSSGHVEPQSLGIGSCSKVTMILTPRALPEHRAPRQAHRFNPRDSTPRPGTAQAGSREGFPMFHISDEHAHRTPIPGLLRGKNRPSPNHAGAKSERRRRSRIDGARSLPWIPRDRMPHPPGVEAGDDAIAVGTGLSQFQAVPGRLGRWPPAESAARP